MWQATLSNNEVIQQSPDVSKWRKQVMERCNRDDLHLISFTWDGEEVDPRGESCFIINDVYGFAGAGVIRARLGLGTFRSNGKGRIIWKTLLGDPKCGNYSEVIPPEKAAVYMELAVERKIPHEAIE